MPALALAAWAGGLCGGLLPAWAALVALVAGLALAGVRRSLALGAATLVLAAVAASALLRQAQLDRAPVTGLADRARPGQRRGRGGRRPACDPRLRGGRRGPGLVARGHRPGRDPPAPRPGPGLRRPGLGRRTPRVAGTARGPPRAVRRAPRGSGARRIVRPRRGRPAGRVVACRRGRTSVAPRLGGPPARPPAGTGAGARRGRRQRPRPAARRGLPGHRHDPPAGRVGNQPDAGGRLPAGAGPVVRRPGPRPLRRGRGRDRRVRAAGAHRAERGPRGGDGRGRAGGDGRRRPPTGSAGAGRGGRGAAAARPGARPHRRVSRCRPSRRPASCWSRPRCATRSRGGCPGGSPRRSPYRSRRSWPAPRSWRPSPARSAWSRSPPTSPRRRPSAPATVLGLARRAGRAGRRPAGPGARDGRGLVRRAGWSRSPSGVPRCRCRPSAGGPGRGRWCC